MEKIAKRILIVEDETSLRKALSRKFTTAGFEVREARDGEEGLGMALREHPDIILLDVIMPVMDGMTMLKQLRKDAWGNTAHVVILTNLSDETTTRDAIEAGAHDFLVKAAWTLDDVLARVQSVLSLSK